MDRPTPLRFFQESLKSEAFYVDELINIYLLRPIAAVVVWLLYPTRVTPNQVTIAAIVIGCCAAGAYIQNTPEAFMIAGGLVTLKDIVDDADGQLARAKRMYSRRGRFLDSIGDFFVDLMLFTALTIVLLHTHAPAISIVLGSVAFLGLTLRVSCHVFYQASFLHIEESYKLNRIIEEVTDEDRQGDPVALRLQIVFNVLYTWQDKLMQRIDAWCKRRTLSKDADRLWYTDKTSLRISGLLGFGTEFALLSACSMFNRLELYFWLNMVLMNGIWVLIIGYRRLVLARSLY